MESKIYGKATVRTYQSNDGSLTWSIIEDELGRSCVGGVETRGKITSTGFRQTWVDAGCLATPLYEYKNQAYGMGNYDDTKGHYVGMWENCLSKIPLIQEYKTRNIAKAGQ